MKKLFATVLVLALVAGSLAVFAACGSTELTIWVGEESAAYYQQVMDKYVADYAQSTGEEFPYKVVVTGVDASTVAATVAQDPQAGPSIFTIPHDNLGKLIGANPILAAVTTPDLLAQIEADNPASYLNVVKMGGITYGVPYIGQALVLYYNKDKVSAEQAKTWEGLMEAAKAAGSDVKATTVMGNDSYNLSFFQLARKVSDNSTSVKIYDGDTSSLTDLLANCYFTGDDTMANFKWAQRFFNDPNGGELAGSTTFDALMKDGKVLSLVGGAWKFNSVSAALGSKLGITKLPTYTITEADAYGTCVAGTEMQSGTFADCKVLCMNAMNKVVKSDKALVESVMKHLSSKEVQEGSFEQCNNLPAYKNASSEFEGMKADTLSAQLAAKQIEMSAYGIAQPFGYSTVLNLYFYQSGADTYTQDILLKRDSKNGNAAAYGTDSELLAGIRIIENIWKTGKANG